MRVFDNPNHPQYGPVRRLWVILAQLDLLASAEHWGRREGMTWDAALVGMMTQDRHVPESTFQRVMLRYIMRG